MEDPKTTPDVAMMFMVLYLSEAVRLLAEGCGMDHEKLMKEAETNVLKNRVDRVTAKMTGQYVA